MSQIDVMTPVSNGGKSSIDSERPYTVTVRVRGLCKMLFHSWNNEAVAGKAKAPKNSKAKTTDDIESYVYRCDDGTIGVPGENFRMSIVNAARFRQDPRSKRKSAMDLYKAGVICLTETASLGVREWDFLDSRRVMIQRNGVTRTRPGMSAGWEAEFELQIQLPAYIDPEELHGVITDAGRLVGLCDFRPTYGRFAVSGFRVSQ